MKTDFRGFTTYVLLSMMSAVVVWSFGAPTWFIIGVYMVCLTTWVAR